MNTKLYNLMDWPEIEGIVYADTDEPQKLLGGRLTKDGYLIQAYRPKAVELSVEVSGVKKAYPMEKVDEAGFFAVLVPSKKALEYVLVEEDVKGHERRFHDPYAFPMELREPDLKKFNAGINYEVYKLLGSHVVTRNGVKGTRFAVWAPNAARVSVVGDFCAWDGRVNQMMRHGDSGVYELFIPGVSEGELYKYEIRTKSGKCIMKADPYARQCQKRPETASIVCGDEKFDWGDAGWIAQRNVTDAMSSPTSIYELHLGSFRKPSGKDRFYNYRELAPMVVDYVKDMGYTHVELMPVMEHPLDESWGYQVTGYYAPTSRFGTPQDFKYFINELHKASIGVILDWVPAHFPRDEFGLAYFDGAPLYEYADPRKGEHPDWGTNVFDVGRPEVSNFLIANALMWAEEFHADGLRMDAVASMLYLDYGRQSGEWVPNIYGGKENLEAVEFFRHLNSIFRKRKLSTMLIAEESTAWPKVTGNVKDDGLGFDYKWNMGWMNDFLSFMCCDPLYRKGHYNDLTFSMIYNYSENFILVLSHDEVVHGKGSMIGKMPEAKEELRFSDLRAAYGFMFTHPGKKLLFMSSDFAQYDEWNEGEEIQWKLLDVPKHRQMNDYVRALNELYKTEPALHEQDYVPGGFEWVNNISANETIIVYLRKAKDGSCLLVVLNFTPVTRKNYKIGVPFAGKYKEIFNSDDKKFGGSGCLNATVRKSVESECDGRDNSIELTVPPLGMTVLRCTPYTEEELIEIDNARKEREARLKREEAKRLLKEAKRLEDEARAIEQKKREVKKTGGDKSGAKVQTQAKRKIPPKGGK
jgi:1,4-alpha-glucan branching enzyme